MFCEQEEADRLAEEARRLEEDRLRKAIEEQERKEKEHREREEQMRYFHNLLNLLGRSFMTSLC